MNKEGANLVVNVCLPPLAACQMYLIIRFTPLDEAI